jgi:hypothetical protein
MEALQDRGGHGEVGPGAFSVGSKFLYLDGNIVHRLKVVT